MGGLMVEGVRGSHGMEGHEMGMRVLDMRVRSARDRDIVRLGLGMVVMRSLERRRGGVGLMMMSGMGRVVLDMMERERREEKLVSGIGIGIGIGLGRGKEIVLGDIERGMGRFRESMDGDIQIAAMHERLTIDEGE